MRVRTSIHSRRFPEDGDFVEHTPVRAREGQRAQLIECPPNPGAVAGRFAAAGWRGPKYPQRDPVTRDRVFHHTEGSQAKLPAQSLAAGGRERPAGGHFRIGEFPEVSVYHPGGSLAREVAPGLPANKRGEMFGLWFRALRSFRQLVRPPFSGGHTKPAHRAGAAPGRSRQTDQGSQLHQRLVQLATSARWLRRLRQMFGMSPEDGVGLLLAKVPLDRQQPRQNSHDIAIHSGPRLSEGDAGDCARGVTPDSRQSQDFIKGGGESDWRLWGAGARGPDNLLRRPVQISRPAIIAQASPEPMDSLLPRPRQSLDGGQVLHPALPIRNDRSHPGLLEHDFRDPDGVRITGAAPGQVASLAGKPGEQRLDDSWHAPRVWVGWLHFGRLSETGKRLNAQYKKSPAEVQPQSDPKRAQSGVRLRQSDRTAIDASGGVLQAFGQPEESGFASVEIKKAIITAAGPTQRTLPLQTLVDRDGKAKTALQILLEEIGAAGIEDICVVVGSGDASAFAAAAGEGGARRLTFVEQREPLGYGHAVHCAREFAAGQPVLLLVGDHLYVSGGPRRCAQQLVEAAEAEDCCVSAVQATHESKLPYYGAVGGSLVPGRTGLYLVSQVLEKPTPTQAEQELIVPGLRAGHYLCFFGMHALTPAVMELLGEQLSEADPGRTHLSQALARVARRERYLACELRGRRYDIGVKYGLLAAQLALALDGDDRDEILSSLVELLARRGRG